jgi:hypothetical protein
MALREIELSGKNPDTPPQYTFKNCTIESADGKKHALVVTKDVDVVFEKCTFKDIKFQVDPAAGVKVTDCTLDAKPLTSEQMKGR